MVGSVEWAASSYSCVAVGARIPGDTRSGQSSPVRKMAQDWRVTYARPLADSKSSLGNS